MEKIQNKLQTISITGGTDLFITKRFIKISSGKAVLCGAKEKAIGVLEVESAANEQASVMTYGIVLVEVGEGGVTEMAEVTSDANGKAIIDATGKTNGVSLDTAVAGSYTRVKLV